MPVYDVPLNTNDQSLERVLNAGLPVALVLWDSRAGLDPALDVALKQAAKAEAGNLLIARLDVVGNPQAAERWKAARLPALVPVQNGVPAGAEALTSPDALRATIDYLLGRGPRPQGQTPRAASRNGAGASAPADLSRPVIVTDATFQRDVLESHLPVVVDFWADWCGPCHMIAPALEKLAAEMGGSVKIAKVNVDENQRYMRQYGIQGIPTLLLVKDGRVVDRIVGALPEPYLRQKIAAFVK